MQTILIYLMMTSLGGKGGGLRMIVGWERGGDDLVSKRVCVCVRVCVCG